VETEISLQYKLIINGGKLKYKIEPNTICVVKIKAK
jgi:hypothetical protein